MAEPTPMQKQGADTLRLHIGRTQDLHGKAKTLEVVNGYLGSIFRWIEKEFGVEQASRTAEQIAEEVGLRATAKFHADPRNKGART